MNKQRKTLTLLLITLLAASFFAAIKPANAGTFKPAVPEFTKLVDRSYDVPLTYINSTNPYTGEQQTSATGGYHVENKTIDVIIKNQPFTSTNIDGNITQLFYVIRWKGHFENWPSDDTSFTCMDKNVYLNRGGVQASNSDYTVKTYTLLEVGNVPEGGKVDFQVKAQVGYFFQYFGGHILPIGTNFQCVAESEWSNTQTLTISNNPQHNATTAPASTPTIPELPWLAILPLALSMLITAVVAKLKKPNFSLPAKKHLS